MKYFAKNKIATIFFVLGVVLFLGKISPVSAAYTDEGTAFYALPNPSSYAAEGTAFFAFGSQQAETIAVYRSFNSSASDHFYTTSSTEKDSSGYTYEGVAFYAYQAQKDGTVPLYRFYNTISGNHFYTASESEKSALINNPQWGYSYEGVMVYVYANQVNGTTNVYRFYSAATDDHFYTASEEEKNSISLSPVYRFVNASSGDHFYTTSESEKAIISNTSQSGYLFEGIAFYAYTTQVNGSVPVYRSVSSATGDHFYTTSSTEKDAAGYAYEGIAFYAFASQTGDSAAVFRLYNPSTGDHFYTISVDEKNRAVATSLGPEISVGLWTSSNSGLNATPFKITANKNYNIKDKDGKLIAAVSGSAQTRVKYDTNGNFTVYNSISSRSVKTEVQFDAADGDNSGLIMDVYRPGSDYDQYRGKIKLRHYDTSNNWVINTLPLEQYVWGAGEFTGTGPYEHTKVMSTIFRTYGYWYIKYATKYSKYGFKIRSDSGSQIYSGYDHESQYANVKKAAQDTKGVVVTYSGDVALTPYCSWSAGETRSYKEAWGSSEYPWCKARHDDWGNYNDSYFENSATKTQSQLISEGNHMVGLIAHGSLHMADKGKSYNYILNYYYSGISLGPVY